MPYQPVVTRPLPAIPAATPTRGRTPSIVRGLLTVVVMLVLAIGGVLLGVEVDALIHGPSARITALANATAPYAAIAALIAMVHRTPWRAALDGAVFFVAFVAGYYLSFAAHVGAAGVNRHYAGVWLLIAAAICPVLTAALTWARRRSGIGRSVIFAVPASAALAEAFLGRTWGMAGVLAASVIACNLLVAAAFILIVPRGLLTRVAAAAWTTPCTIAIVWVALHLGRTDAYYRWMYGQ